MSQLLQIATRKGGAVAAFNALTAPAFFDQGIPFDSAGQIAVDNVGGIDHFWQGLPFTAVGRLVSAIDVAVDRIAPGGAPFTAAGRLVFGNGAVDHYSHGIPYTITNQIKTA